jgi:hypothetical protein
MHTESEFTEARDKAINKRFSDLSLDELKKICQKHPRWAFNLNPHAMIIHNPEWACRFAPEWVLAQYPGIVCELRPDWASFKHPKIMALMNFNGLVLHNPEWAIAYAPRKIEAVCPQLISDFDPDLRDDDIEYSEKGGLRKKSTFMSWLARVYSYLKNARHTDPVIPGSYLD